MYPIAFEADFVQERSRLTNFFRGIMAYPALIVSGLYGFVAYLAAFIVWFAILFTGRYPEGLYNFVSGYVRNSARVNAYCYLLCDPYPPFNGNPDDAYPVRVGIAPRQESYSRVKVFFRFLLEIPLLIVLIVYGIAALFALIGAWFAILFTGKMPEGIQGFLTKFTSLSTMTSAYALYLTDEYPPFSGESGASAPSAPSAPAPPAAPVAPAPPV